MSENLTDIELLHILQETLLPGVLAQSIELVNGLLVAQPSDCRVPCRAPAREAPSHAGREIGADRVDNSAVCDWVTRLRLPCDKTRSLTGEVDAGESQAKVDAEGLHGG